MLRSKLHQVCRTTLQILLDLPASLLSHAWVTLPRLLQLAEPAQGAEDWGAGWVQWELRGKTIGKPYENGGLPSGNVKMAIKHGHLYWIYLLNRVLFYSYVCLLEGIWAL